MSTIKWTIDPTHSEINFKAKHLVISSVTGKFKQFEGQAEAGAEDFDGAKVSFTAEISSIDTNQPDRDAHLKSADFFDAEKYPVLKFENGLIEKSGGDYKLKGELTIKDITKPVVLDADFGGIAEDPYGNTKAGFEIEGKVNRKDFGLTWSAITEAGNVVVGDTIRIMANVQFVKN